MMIVAMSKGLGHTHFVFSKTEEGGEEIDHLLFIISGCCLYLHVNGHMICWSTEGSWIVVTEFDFSPSHLAPEELFSSDRWYIWWFLVHLSLPQVLFARSRGPLAPSFFFISAPHICDRSGFFSALDYDLVEPYQWVITSSSAPMTR